MCACLWGGQTVFLPGWGTLETTFGPQISTLSCSKWPKHYTELLCVCVSVCVFWVSLCSVIFYSLKLLIPKSLAGMLCYFLMALTLCIVLIGTRLAADVQSAADCQRRGHSSVALAGKELTPCSWAEPTLSLYLTEYIAMEEIAEMPPRFPSMCST